MAGKAQIREQVRASRYQRRAAHSDTYAEALGLYRSWTALLASLAAGGLSGLGEGAAAKHSRTPEVAEGPAASAASAEPSLSCPLLRLPALFWPTANEPDVRMIVRSCGDMLLPMLIDEDGDRLCEPSWGFVSHRRGQEMTSVLHSTASSYPLQPVGTASGPQTLADASLVLVPALAVDATGTRLGQGGGWYDRALTFLRPGTPLVAVVFDEDFFPADALPRESHDIAVSAVITPKQHFLAPSPHVSGFTKSELRG